MGVLGSLGLEAVFSKMLPNIKVATLALTSRSEAETGPSGPAVSLLTSHLGWLEPCYVPLLGKAVVLGNVRVQCLQAFCGRWELPLCGHFSSEGRDFPRGSVPAIIRKQVRVHRTH